MVTFDLDQDTGLDISPKVLPFGTVTSVLEVSAELIAMHCAAESTYRFHIFLIDGDAVQLNERAVGVQGDGMRAEIVVHLGRFTRVEEDDSDLFIQLRSPRRSSQRT